jgi:FtsZ-binding cell division protein ZapB
VQFEIRVLIRKIRDIAQEWRNADSARNQQMSSSHAVYREQIAWQ